MLPEEDAMVGKKGMQYFEDCWESEAAGPGIAVNCVRVKGTNHDSTTHPANEVVAKMFERARRT